MSDAPPAPGTAARWLAEIEAHDKEHRAWHEQCDKIARRYRNEAAQGDETRRFALLWSNVQVLKPTLYARDPQPSVTRRFRDKDRAARVAAKLLERCLVTLLDRGRGAYGRTARRVVLDLLLYGRGAGRVRYVHTPDEDGLTRDEDAALEPLHRRDFGFTAGARTWDEVKAVWFVSYLTRAELVRRFPDEGDRVPLDHKPPGDDDAKQQPVESKAAVYEIWDSDARTVTWLARGMADAIESKPYPLKLIGRFPCPAPLFGTLKEGGLVPVPDFKFYQDQAAELDLLTGRIAALAKALRVVGFTSGDSVGDLQLALDSPGEAQFVALPAWAMGQGRPADNMIAWLPIAEVANVLARLIEVREAVKRDAYEVTGLSDILRGQTQASETATAQQIKAQWGGIRVREAQQDVARFCADALTVMAEVVCGHFEPQRIAQLGYLEGIQDAQAPGEPAPPETMPGVPPAPGPTVGDMALQLLGAPAALLHARVDVESDSTVAPDEAADREATSELLSTVGGLLGPGIDTIGKIVMFGPQAQQAAAAAATLLGELIGKATRGRRGGEAVEAAVEAFTEAMVQAAQQPPPPPPEAAPPPPAEPTPADQIKAQQVQMDGQRMQLDAAVAQDESRHRDADREVEMAKMQVELARPETAVVQ